MKISRAAKHSPITTPKRRPSASSPKSHQAPKAIAKAPREKTAHGLTSPDITDSDCRAAHAPGDAKVSKGDECHARREISPKSGIASAPHLFRAYFDGAKTHRGILMKPAKRRHGILTARQRRQRVVAALHFAENIVTRSIVNKCYQEEHGVGDMMTPLAIHRRAGPRHFDRQNLGLM